MLATLNTFLGDAASRAADDRILWHDIGDEPGITLARLKRELGALRYKLEGCTARRWLLFSDNPHHFLLGFLVLLGLKRKVVICASKKPEWLRSFSTEFDAILSDEIINPGKAGNDERNKPYYNFELSPQVNNIWRPEYDGGENIVFFTSGSTGHPKAIEKTLLALTNEVVTLGETFAEELRGSLFVASVSHLHIYGLLFRILLPLYIGEGSVRQQIKYPEQLLSLAEKFAQQENRKKMIFISSPAFLGRLDLHLPPVTMRTVFSSGGPLSFTVAQDSQKYFMQTPVEVYGSTETGGIGYRQQKRPETMWTSFAGIKLVEKEEGVELLSAHMPGCPPYMLDDNLDILPDNRFVIKGRKDRIVKVAEKRISLTEIEKFLETEPEIRQCVAMSINDRREVIACAVVLTDEGKRKLALSGQRFLFSRWKRMMRGRFEATAIPRKWRILTEIPVNSQNKIDVSLLTAEFVKGKAPH